MTKSRLILFLLLLIGTIHAVHGQNFDWVRTIGNGLDGEVALSCDIGPSGEVVAIGYLHDGAYPFITKFDSVGNTVWMNTFDGGVVTSVELDSVGNVHVSGWLVSPSLFDFDPGSDTVLVNTEANAYVAKYNSDGEFIWVSALSRLANIGGVNSESVDVDRLGNVLVTGTFTRSVDFDPGPAIYADSIDSGRAAYILKLNSDGEFDWVKTIKSDDIDTYGIAVDENNSVCMVGQFQGTCDFDPGPDTTELTSLNTTGGSNAFVVKLNSSGDLHWAHVLPSITYSAAKDVEFDRFGNVYLTGRFGGDVDFDPGSGTHILSGESWSDAFVLRLTANGEFIWVREFEHYADFKNVTAESLSVDADANVYITGQFSSYVDFYSGPGQFLLFYNHTSELTYVAKLDANGNLNFAKMLRKGNSYGFGIAADDDGNIALVGKYKYTVDFDPSPNEYELTATGPGYWHDAYILRWGYCEVEQFTVDETVCSSIISPDGASTWTNSGVYVNVLQNSVGCDSMIIMDLTVLNTTSTIDAFACDSYQSPDQNEMWTVSGTFIDTIPNAAGCDSIITVNLEIGRTYSSMDVEECTSYLSPSGQMYTSAGIYVDTVPNSFGCDSVITINLSFNNTDTIFDVTMCDGLISPDGMENWTASGTYHDTIPNTSGCDSIITVNLEVIGQSYSSSLVETSCHTYTSAGGNEWTQSGIYADTLSSISGCDSVVTVNLTILQDSYNEFDDIGCGSYVSPSGSYMWTQNGLFNDTLTNILGCDSIITVGLAIVNVDTSITQSGLTLVATASANSYQWLDCNNGMMPIAGANGHFFEPTENGTYAVQLIENGCVDTSACVVISSIGVLENSFGGNIKVYPNPTSRYFSVDFDQYYEFLTVEILDITGKSILSKAFKNHQRLNLELEAPTGVYLLLIQSEDEIAKIRIEKK